MNDFARCVQDCEMDELEMVYPWGSAATNLVAATRWRSMTAVTMRAAPTWATPTQAMA